MRNEGDVTHTLPIDIEMHPGPTDPAMGSEWWRRRQEPGDGDVHVVDLQAQMVLRRKSAAQKRLSPRTLWWGGCSNRGLFRSIGGNLYGFFV